MKKKRLAAIVILLVVIIAVVLVYRYRGQKDDGALRLSGNVEVTETNVAFKIPGRVIARLVDEGDRVKEGDTIAKLDSAELAAVEAQNKASLKEAVTKLAELKAGSRSQEIEQARANVKAQEADLLKVRKDFERSEVLYRNGAISASQFDISRSAYESRQAPAPECRRSTEPVKGRPQGRGDKDCGAQGGTGEGRPCSLGGEAQGYRHIFPDHRDSVTKKRGAGRDGGPGDTHCHPGRPGKAVDQGLCEGR